MTGRAWWRRGLKIVHELSGIGVGGGFAACLVLGWTADPGSPAAFLASRDAVAAICRWILVPSLAVVLVSGLLAIAATRGYHSAGWAWVKAATGLLLFESTLVTVAASTRQAELAGAAVAGDPSLAAALLRSERTTLWVLLALVVANVVLAVWRPRLAWKVR